MKRFLERYAFWVGIATCLAVVAALTALNWPDEEPRPESPVNLAASAPRFASLGELVAAADVVVIGTIVDEQPGRAITEPADPIVGIRSVFLEVDVERVLYGDLGSALVIEHEAALLDGTTITIDGVGPPAVGERGVYFLIGSQRPDEPYFAIVGPQGRFALDDDLNLSAHVVDPVANRVAEAGLDALVARLAGLDD